MEYVPDNYDKFLEHEARMNAMHEDVMEVLTEKGYHEFGTNVFVPEKDAYEYALEKCLHGEDHEEFKKMLVEWFYSGGNWTEA